MSLSPLLCHHNVELFVESKSGQLVLLYLIFVLGCKSASLIKLCNQLPHK